jgi:hypothetical protein
MLVNSGIRRIVFDEAYRVPLDPVLISECDMEFVQVPLKDANNNAEVSTQFLDLPDSSLSLMIEDRDGSMARDSKQRAVKAEKSRIMHGVMQQVADLIKWQDSATDMYGEELEVYVVHVLSKCDAEKVPPALREALRVFQSLSDDDMYLTVKHVLNTKYSRHSSRRSSGLDKG